MRCRSSRDAVRARLGGRVGCQPHPVSGGAWAAVAVPGRGGDLDLPRPVPRLAPIASVASGAGRPGWSPLARHATAAAAVAVRCVPAAGPGWITRTRQPGASLTWLQRAHVPLPLPQAVRAAVADRGGVVGVHDRRPAPRGGAHVVAQHQHPPQQPGEHPPPRVHRDQVPPVRGGVQPAHHTDGRVAGATAGPSPASRGPASSQARRPGPGRGRGRGPGPARTPTGPGRRCRAGPGR